MSAIASTPKPLQRILNDPYWLRQFSVEEYHKMINSGVFSSNNRVELLEGWIVNKMPQNPPHASSVTRTASRIGRFCPDNWTLRVQMPITLSDSEPEPDITRARGDEETFDTRHPEPTDIGVLIEVGDSSVLEDRRYKGELYAREKIGEFWLINLVARKIEAYTKPRGGKYQKKTEFFEKDIVPLILDGVKIADIPVRELLTKS